MDKKFQDEFNVLMRKSISISSFFVLFFCLNSWARLSDGKVHLKLEQMHLVGGVDEGFHFNKDAPATLTWGSFSEEPVRKTPESIEFDVSKVKGEDFAVTFYICDNKNTVCEAHEFKYRISEGKLLASTNEPRAKIADSSSTNKNKTSLLKKSRHGFYQDDLEGVLALAGKENKLILADFGAPWCPSCIRLETEVFNEKIFQKSTKDLIKVSINIDKIKNKTHAKKYEVQVIPTLILMNSKGEELARLTDYRPAKVLVKELELLLAKPKFAVEILKVKAEKGDRNSRISLGERAFYSMNFEEAVKWLAPLNENSLMLAISEVGMHQGNYEENKGTQRASYQKVLQKWIALYPESLEAILWRGELIKVLKGDAKDVAPEANEVAHTNISRIQFLLQTEASRTEIFAKTLSGDYRGFEKCELLAQLADNYDSVGDQKNADVTRERLAKEIGELKLSDKRPGQVLVALGYMKQAHLKVAMISWYERLIKAYPQTDIYYAKLSRFYFREKMFEKALPLAEKAAAIPSDLNLYNMKNLAEVYKELHRNDEALSVIGRALVLPEAGIEQNKKTVSDLEEMKKSLHK